jgi:phospholipase C
MAMTGRFSPQGQDQEEERENPLQKVFNEELQSRAKSDMKKAQIRKKVKKARKKDSSADTKKAGQRTLDKFGKKKTKSSPADTKEAGQRTIDAFSGPLKKGRLPKLPYLKKTEYKKKKKAIY